MADAVSEKQTSTIVRERLLEANRPYKANDSIWDILEPGELEQIQQEVEDAFEKVLVALVIDIDSDPNTRNTAYRMAKMYCREVFSGRYLKPETCTDFPNTRQLDELYTVGPITVRSSCSHHFCPVEGDMWVGVVPGDRIIGLSKFARIAKSILSRPQIQEEAVIQVADELERLIKPKGLAVVIRARHSCMTWRGINERTTTMTSSVTRGYMRVASATRTEFFNLIASQGFNCS